MRFTAVSLSLLALAHSVAPAPLHPNSHDRRQPPIPCADYPCFDSTLVSRQGPTSIVAGLLGALSDLVNTVDKTLLGGTSPSAQTLQSLVQEIQGVLAGVTSKLPRALPSSPGAVVLASSSTSTSSSAPPNIPPPAATVANASSTSSGNPQVSTSARTARVRRQLSSPPTTPSPTPGPSGVGSQGGPQPSQSSVASAPGSESSPSSQPGASNSADGQSTAAVPSPSASRA